MPGLTACGLVDEGWRAMSGQFPSPEEMRRQAAEADARPAVWREENLVMVQEFLAKTEAAGLSRTWLIPRRFVYGGTGTEAVKLAPGPPPQHWLVAELVETGNTYKPWYEHVDRVVSIDELPQLAEWDPEWLRTTLLGLLPR